MPYDGLSAAERIKNPFSRAALRDAIGPSNPLYHFHLDNAIQDIISFTDDFWILDANHWTANDTTNGAEFAAVAGARGGQITVANGANNDAASWIYTATGGYDTDYRPAVMFRWKCSQFDQYTVTTDTTEDLDGAIDAVQTTLVTDAGTSAITTDTVIIIDSEWMLVTTGSVASVIVQRGYLGTARAAHADNTDIYSRGAGDRTKIEIGFYSTASAADNDGNDSDTGQVLLKSTPTGEEIDFGLVCLDTDDNDYFDVIGASATAVTTTNVDSTLSWDGGDDVWQTVMVSLNENDEVRGWRNGQRIPGYATGSTGGIDLGLWFLYQNRDATGRDVEVDYCKTWMDRTSQA